MPKVLISDALSPAAVQIFKDRGIEVDFQPNLGKDKDKLAEIIGDYDGLAIRSATKVTPKILEKAKNLKVIGRAGIGVDNVDIPAATAARHDRDEHAVRQFDHHRRARHLADAGAGAPNSGGRRLDPRRQVGEEPLHGRRDFRQDARRHRLRQYRLDRRRPRHRPEDEGDRLRSVPVAGARAAISASRRSSSTSCSSAPTSSRCTRRSPTRPRNIIDAAALAEDEEGRAHHQLRPRRPGRRGGACRGARSPATSPAPPSTCSSRSRRRTIRCSACPTSSARRISAPPTSEAQENVALQVAEQMSDYLLRGAISNAVNFPSITRRGGAAAEAVHRARREARLVRRPAHRDRHQQGAASPTRARSRR